MVSRSRFSYIACGLAVGGFAFWLPIVAAYWLFGGDWGAMITSLLLTFLLPVFCCFVLEIFATTWKRPRAALSAAMVCGIWVSGPFFMTLANTSMAGEGFHLKDAWNFVGSATAMFPVSTFMLSTYSGALFAVQFTTLLLPIFATREWTFQPLMRRCSVCRFLLHHI